MFLTRPTFTTGFAKNASESAYPELWNGLVGLWSPEMGKQGLFLYDFSGRNHKGTLNSIDPSTAYVSGKRGYALNYTGSSTFVDCGTIPEIDDASKNLTLIFNMRSSATVSQTLITYDNNSVLQPATDWYCYCANAGNLKIGGFGSTGELDTGITSASLRDGKFHQVVIILKQTTLEVYVDGVLRYNPANTKTHGNFGSSFSLQFGSAENVASYVGDLGEVRLYNRDLTPSEVRNTYIGASPLTLSPLFVTTSRPITLVEDSDTLTLSDSLDVNERTANISDTLTISDSILVTETSVIASDNITVSDSLVVDERTVNQSDTLTISDSISVDVRTVTDSDTLTLSDSMIIDEVNTNYSTNFGIRILSINPLLFISQDLEIIKVDTSIPASPTWIIENILGITAVYDAFLNDTNEFVYVAANNGLVIKIEIADLTNQTIINLSDASNVSTIDGLPLFGLTYASTDQTTGEFFIIDERNTFLIDSDFEALSRHFMKLDSDFNLIHAFKIDSDIQVLSLNTFHINSDFKCLTSVLDTIDPIPQSAFRVYIDNVEVIDPDLSLDSISIIHTIDQESVATFKLNRHHDDLNRNLDGNTIVINAQNDCRIEIDGRIEFNGKIGDLDCQYSTSAEQILVTAYQPQPDYLFNNITVPLSSLDKRLGLYDVLLQNPKILNPYIDPRIIILSDLGEYWTNAGTWSTSLGDVKVFATYADAANYITLHTEPYTDQSGVLRYEFVIPSFASRNPVIGSPGTTPKKYKGIVANLGKLTIQDHIKYFFSDPFGDIATSIQDGTFHPRQNWTYFWSATVIKPRFFQPTLLSQEIIATDTEKNKVDVKEITTTTDKYSLGLAAVMKGISKSIADIAAGIFPGNNETVASGQTTLRHYNYIGTSLSPISSDIWVLKHAEHHYQRINPDKVTDLGYYSVGSAPFKEINPKSGKLIPMWYYTDENDGMYWNMDASYDYTDYVKKVVDLEYKKLKNINDDILPDTSCSLSLSIDAYYYYGMKLLTRLNIDNTYQANTYKDNNGFPVSIKSITISSADMLISLQTDNVMSRIEQNQLNKQYPDEKDFESDAKHILYATKSDMSTDLEVE